MPKPLVVKLETLLEYSRSVGRGFRLVAPSLRDGETLWEGGLWYPRSGSKPLHVSSLFELGFAAPHHAQDLHAHPDSYEIYVFLGRGVFEFIDEGCLHAIEVSGGDAVIVPPGVYHRVRLEDGGLYTVLVPPSREKIVYKGGVEGCKDS